MTPTLSSRIPTVALLCATLACGQAALGQTPFDPNPALLEEEVDAPPVFDIEVLIFQYNEFNPVEEEFGRLVPHWPKSLTDVHITGMPETLEPSSADWYLDSLTLPRALDTVRDTTADLLPGAAADSPTTLPPVTSSTSTGAAMTSPITTTPEALYDEFGNTISPSPSPQSAFEDGGPWYRMLAPEALELGRAAARLSALDAYTPLVHVGWSQQALLEDEAIAFDLAWLGRLRPAGTIRLHRSRFLHLTVDLSLQDDYRYVEEPIPFGARWPLAELRGPVRYSLQAQRRIRSEELHFFDHPAFGILIVVRPVAEDSDSEDPETSGPAA